MTPAAGPTGAAAASGRRPGDTAGDDLVLLDDDLVPRGRAVISAFDRAVMYGESLFETLKVVDGAPCLWDPHVRRLAAGCEELGIPLDVRRLEAGVRRLMALHAGTAYGVLRVQVTGGEQPGGGRGITAPPRGRRPRVAASVAASAPPADSVYDHGVRVVAATDLSRPSPWLKSGNYLASVRAKALAEAADAFECLLAQGDPPVLLEGSFSNLLVWDGDVLASPPEGARLPGVTLGVVLEEAVRAGIEVVVRPVGLSEVAGEGPDGAADTGLLLTSSLLGACPCSHLDGRPLRSTTEVATVLRKGLHAREEAARNAWAGAAG